MCRLFFTTCSRPMRRKPWKVLSNFQGLLRKNLIKLFSSQLIYASDELTGKSGAVKNVGEKNVGLVSLTASMWVPLVKPFLYCSPVPPPCSNAGQCKPKAGDSGFGLPALSFMRGRSNPPSFYAIDFLQAEARTFSPTIFFKGVGTFGWSVPVTRWPSETFQASIRADP